MKEQRWGTSPAGAGAPVVPHLDPGPASPSLPQPSAAKSPGAGRDWAVCPGRIFPSAVPRFWFIFFLFFGFPACWILVPWPGIEPAYSAVKAQSPNHWTTREFPLVLNHTPN